MGLAFLIATENLQLLSERKVLKESDYAALLEAAGVIQAARTEAKRIVQKAVSEAEAMRHDAYQTGLQNAKTEYAERLLAVAQDNQTQLHGLRESMAQLVAKAVSQFIAEADPQALFEAALLRVQALIRSEPFVSVRVAPAREDALRAALDRLRADVNWSVAVSVQADPTLATSDCVMHTASGTLELGVDAQLQAFQRVLRSTKWQATTGGSS